MDKLPINKKDASTETSSPTVDLSTSSSDTLTDNELTVLNFNPILTKESYDTFEETSDDSEVKTEESAKSKSILKSSKSKHVRQFQSSEKDSEDKLASESSSYLKSSKSQHVKKLPSSSEDESSDVPKGSINYSNLQKGNVFVYMVIPPDGGYGWFITFISFLCQVVVDGIILAIGIILPHIAREFDIPGSKVILVASMQVGFYFLSGTVSSAFINKFGFRPVALAGCVLSIAVLLIATFSTNLTMMIIFYSILGGPGLSMIWVSSQLIIGYYFEKYRPIANGISCSGAGVGLMMFSYMNSVLVIQLGWRNLMRIHVGFLLMVLLMCLTFVEVAPTRIGRVKEIILEDSESDSADLVTDMTRFSRFYVKANDQEHTLDDNFESMFKNIDNSTPEEGTPSGCNSCLKNCCPFCYRFIERHREKEAVEAAKNRYVIKQDLIDRKDLFYMGPKEPKETDDRETHDKTSRRASIVDEDGEYRSISLDEIDNIHQRYSIAKRLSAMHINQDGQHSQQRYTYKELKRTAQHPLLEYFKPKNLIHPKIRKVFSLLFDFRLLNIMEFRILLLSAFLFPMGFNIPFVYSTVRAQIDPSFAKLITPTIGFSNFAFRIASGFVAYKYREYTTYICGGGMFFGGLAVFGSAFYGLDVVWFQFVYAMCYGIAPAFYSTLRAIIYVRSLGLDKLTNAFGLTALAMGMGVFIGTTTGGILNDFTGSYTASFIFAGCCICASGVLKLVLPYLIKITKDKKVKN